MQYNLSDEQVEVHTKVATYKPFPGRSTKQMPLLLNEGRAPLWAARFMRRRIDYSGVLPDLLDYLDVSDLVTYDSIKRSKDIKLILTVDKNGTITQDGRKALELINPNTKLTLDFAANIERIYDGLSGIVIPRTKLGLVERDLSAKEILDSRIWRILARHPDEVPAEFAEDKGLLKEYARWVKSQTKQNKNMAVYFDTNSRVAKLRAWYVDGLGYGSRLVGRYGLRSDDGRLVGFLASETPNAPGKTN